MVIKVFKTEFSVIGTEVRKRLFPHWHQLPKPGQWVYVESPTNGIERVLVQIASVNLSIIGPNLYQVQLEVTRASLKEDILFAKLARRQFDQVDRDGEILEPLNFSSTITKTQEFEIHLQVIEPGYSDVNYSNDEYSESDIGHLKLESEDGFLLMEDGFRLILE